MKVGIIGAMESEVSLLKEALQSEKTTQVGPATFFEGTISGVECVVVRSGIGKVAMAATAQALIDRFSPDLLINTGVGGGLGEKLEVGDVVIATDLVQHDVDVTALGEIPGKLPGFPPHFEVDHSINAILESELAKEAKDISVYAGRIASGDQFINTPEQRALIKKRFDALVAEMEGASLGEVAYLNKIPCCVLRAISDTGKEGGAVEYEKFEKEAAARMAHLLIHALSKLKMS